MCVLQIWDRDGKGEKRYQGKKIKKGIQIITGKLNGALKKIKKKVESYREDGRLVVS